MLVAADDPAGGAHNCVRTGVGFSRLEWCGQPLTIDDVLLARELEWDHKRANAVEAARTVRVRGCFGRRKLVTTDRVWPRQMLGCQ
jgi:hypothetical protein